MAGQGRTKLFSPLCVLQVVRPTVGEGGLGSTSLISAWTSRSPEGAAGSLVFLAKSESDPSDPTVAIWRHCAAGNPVHGRATAAGAARARAKAAPRVADPLAAREAAATVIGRAASAELRRTLPTSMVGCLRVTLLVAHHLWILQKLTCVNI